jgi:O-antigen/teichoic acid export membrane protein
MAIATPVVIARAAGAEGKGVFTLAVGVGSIGALMLGFRWQRPVGYFLARDRGLIRPIFTSILLVAMVTPALGILLFLLVPDLYTDILLRGQTWGIIWLSICLMAPTFLWQNLSAWYGGLRAFKTRTVFLLASGFVQLIAILVQALLGTREVESFLRVQLLVSLALYAGWMGVMVFRQRIVPTVDLPLMGRMAKYTSFSYLAVVLDLATVRLDMFLLNYLMNPAAVGIYSVAVGLANQMGRLPTIIATVIFNRTSANELGGGERTALAIRLAFLGMLGVGVVFAAGGSLVIVPLFGPEFAGAVAPLWVMTAATVFLGLFRLLGADIEGRGRPGLLSWCSLVAAVSIVILDLWWIPLYGVMGAAWASLVAYALAAGAGAIAFSRLSGIRLGAAFAPRWSDFTLLAAAMRGLRRRRPDGLNERS